MRAPSVTPVRGLVPLVLSRPPCRTYRPNGHRWASRRRMPPHPISLIFDLCVVVERSWRGPVRRSFRCRGRDLLRTAGPQVAPPPSQGGEIRERPGVGDRDELGSAPGVHAGKRVILLFRCSGRLFERAGPAGERQRGRAPADQRTRRGPLTKSHRAVTAGDKSTINPEGKQQMSTLSRAHGHIRSAIPSPRGPSSGNGRVPAEMRSAGGGPIERSCAKPDNRYLHERPGTTGQAPPASGQTVHCARAKGIQCLSSPIAGPPGTGPPTSLPHQHHRSTHSRFRSVHFPPPDRRNSPEKTRIAFNGLPGRKRSRRGCSRIAAPRG